MPDEGIPKAERGPVTSDIKESSTLLRGPNVK